MKFSMKDALVLMKKLNIKGIDEDEFLQGLIVEMEHGKRYPECNVTNDDPIMTAKIAWAHLKELPDYYTRLNKMEEEGKKSLQKDKIPGMIDEMVQEFIK